MLSKFLGVFSLGLTLEIAGVNVLFKIRKDPKTPYEQISYSTRVNMFSCDGEVHRIHFSLLSENVYSTRERRVHSNSSDSLIVLLSE